MIHDMPQPCATRRGMAFTDAVFDGRAALAGIEAVRLNDVDDIMDALATRVAVPVTVGDFSALVTAVGPDILVDGRMRKRSHPEAQRGLAKLTIGKTSVSWRLRRSITRKDVSRAPPEFSVLLYTLARGHDVRCARASGTSSAVQQYPLEALPAPSRWLVAVM
jgi:hypothetical protein